MDYTNILSRNKFLLVVFILLLPTLIWLATRRTFLYISVSGQGSEKVSVLYSVNSKETKKIKTGLNFIKPGKAIINVNTDNKQSIAFPKVRVLSYNNVNIQLEDQKSSAKLLSGLRNSVTCIYDTGPNDVYSCQKNKIYKQVVDNGIRHIEIYPTQTIISGVVELNGGTATIVRETTEGASRYNLVNYTGSNQKVLSKIDELIPGDAGNPRLFTSEDKNKLLVINPRTLNLTIFNTNNSLTIKTKLDDSFKNINFEQLAVTFNGREIKIISPINIKEEGDALGDSNTKVKLNKFVISGNKITKDFDTVLNLNKIDGDYLFYKNTLLLNGQDGYLHIYNIDNKKNILQASIPQVNNVVIAGENIFYSSQKGVYKYNNEIKQSQLIHKFKEINESKLLSLKGRPVLVGNTDNSPSTFGAYIVTDKKIEGGIDLFDLIPYSPKVLPIISSEYIGDDIYFSVDLKSLIIDRDTGSYTYDPREFDQKKTIITEKLRADGIDLSKYKIHFNPGP